MSTAVRRDILMFSTADWDNPFWTNKQHTATLFAKRGYRVLYVDSLGLRRPALHRRDLRRMAARLGKAVPLTRRVHPNIWRVSPLVLPLHESAWARSFNTCLLKATIKWHLMRLHMSAPLIWTYSPVTARLCSELPNSGIVYHCVDDLGAAPRIDGAAVAAGEAHLGTVAELCFATSPLLYERMRPLFRRVVYEPNVCDRSFFETAQEPLSLPEDLAGIPEPRVLFVGALSEYKVDYSLMEKVAARNPSIHWVLIGNVGEGQPDSRIPPALPNIHVLGPRAHGRLPYYMAHCRAAVLPAARNAYTDAMFPMKFFEFLAAGLQVVGVRLPALAEFENLYFPSDSVEAFEANLTRVLGGEERSRQAIEAACRIHSWEARFARMEVVLDEVFPLRKTPVRPFEVQAYA